MSVDSASTPSTPSTPSSPPTDPYEIEVVKKEDEQEVRRFLRIFFIKDEPLNCSLDIADGKPTCDELENFCVKGFDNGISFKAVSNGRIIGLALNGVLEKGYIDELGEVNVKNQKFAKILRLLDHVAVQSNIFAQFPDTDKAMTVKILSVDSSWRGRGIAKELMNTTRELARKQDCGLMTVDCSSHFTALAVKRLGLTCIYSLNYKDYKVNGEVVLAPALPHEAVTVYAQRL